MELEIGLALASAHSALFAGHGRHGLRPVERCGSAPPHWRERRQAGSHDQELFLKQALENRPRFSFALSAMIQILLVVVAVLITSISLNLFPDPRLVLVGLCRRSDPRRHFSSTDPALHLDTKSRSDAAVSASGRSSVLSGHDFHRRSFSATLRSFASKGPGD